VGYQSSAPGTAPTTAKASLPTHTGTTASKRSAPAAPACYYEPLPAAEVQNMPLPPGPMARQVGALSPLIRNVSYPPEPGLTSYEQAMSIEPYGYNCGGTVSVVWVVLAGPPSAAPKVTRPVTTPGRPSTTEAAFLYASASTPPLTINLNPAAAGITNLPSYFSVTGYDGKPIYEPGLGTGGSVELRLTPEGYLWSFGDGSSLRTDSLGQANQPVSDIAHTYTVRSDWSPYASGGLYSVQVTAYFDVAFQVILPGQTLVPNGTWVDFSTYGYPPLQETATHAYKVGEVVSALTG
jgi:hypothetical protein